MNIKTDIRNYFKNFIFDDGFVVKKTAIDLFNCQNKQIPFFVNEFWTSKQRQGNALHEISYRACFKSELPRFFINLFSKVGDFVYDPFSGRGTTIIEACIMGRNVISNDINPLSKILAYPRLCPPDIKKIENRLKIVPIEDHKSDIDLSMFYHPDTEKEIVSLKVYLENKKKLNDEDDVDRWIRMVATNRLTGHSKGFFSVYTLPPNQAVMPKRQIKINKQNKQTPEYRNTKKIILKKSKSLLRDLSFDILENLKLTKRKSLFLENDSGQTKKIKNNSIQLTITSPPFLDVVQYHNDNWLRCWFNSINTEKVEKKIKMIKKIECWNNVMRDTFKELYRITKKGGYVIFEVGEIRNSKINLEEEIIPIGIKTGFACSVVMINKQKFTKTSNIWGVSNNKKGTNSNRIIIFNK